MVKQMTEVAITYYRRQVSRRWSYARLWNGF